MQTSDEHPGIIERPRLVALMNDLAECSLVAVYGPRASGKSTLLDAWVAQFPGETVRITITDSDVEAFERHLLRRITDLRPDPLVTVDEEDGPSDTSLATVLAERVTAERPLWLVVDVEGRNLVPGHPDVFDRALARPIPGMHLVVATAMRVPFPLGRFHALGHVGAVRAWDLAFTPSEVVELGTAVSGVRPSEESLVRLHTETKGWVGLVRAALATARVGEDGDPLPERQVRWTLHRTIDREILADLTEGERGFLLDTAGLDVLDPVLCDLVLERRDSEEMLARLEQVTAFVDVVDPTTRTWKVDEVVAATLRAIRSETGETERSRKITRVISEWFAEKDAHAHAIERLVRDRDWEGTVDLVQRHAAALSVHTDLREVLASLQTIPMSVMRANHAGFQAMITLHIAAGNVQRSMELLGEFEQEMRSTQPEAWIDQSFLHGAWAALGEWRGENLDTLTHAERALELLARRPSEAGLSLGASNADWSRTLVRIAGGRALFHMGRWNEALEWFDAALVKPGRAHQAVRATAARGWVQMWLGDLTDAEASVAQAERIAHDLAGPADWLVEVHLLRAAIAWHRGDWTTASDQLDHAWSNRAPRRTTKMAARLVQLTAALDLSQGNFRRGLTRFDAWRKEGRVPLDGHLQAQLAATEARLAVAYGQLDYAQRLVDRASDGPDLPAARALLALTKGDDRALTLELDRWQHSDAVTHRIEYQLFRALRADRVGDPKARSAALAEAAHAGNAEGLVPVYLDTAPGVVPMLEDELTGNPSDDLAALVERLERVTGRGKARLLEQFTQREAEILELLPSYLSATEIAAQLGISTSTLKSHQRRLYLKLGVHRRADAVRRASESGLLRAHSTISER